MRVLIVLSQKLDSWRLWFFLFWVLFFGWFIHSSSPYYLFFNYLSYYLYGVPVCSKVEWRGVPVCSKNRVGQCTRMFVENSH